MIFFIRVDDSDSQHDSDVSLDCVTVPENSEERRSFLQTRIAAFARTLAVVSSVFLLASSSSYFILHPHPWLSERLSLDRYDLLAIFLWVVLWLFTGGGRIRRATLGITDAEPWTQTQARDWWDHNRAVLAHLRKSRVGGASGPNRPRILRSLASPEDALAPTASATRRPA